MTAAGLGRHPVGTDTHVSEQDQTGETFTELVIEKKGRRSYDDLVKDSGGVVSRSRMQDYGAPGMPLENPINSATIRGMAIGLRVPEERVWLALGRELGHYKGEGLPRLAKMINPEADLLTRAQERLILDLVDELVTAQKAQKKAGATATDEAADANVRPIRRAARRKTGTEDRGPRGGAKND